MVRDIDIAPSIDDSEVIWKYMDFASFCSLLHTEGLFFRRLDKYSDKYEGTLPDEIKFGLAEQLSSGLPWLFNSKEHVINSFDNSFNAHLREYNKGILSCSWVASLVENYAMWKIYLRGSNEGVAIRTTVGRLREVLKEKSIEFTLAKVKYEMPLWSQSEYKTLAIYKTEPYSFESELRILVYDQFDAESVPTNVFPKIPLYEHGTTFQVDPSKLIDGVYVSPFSDLWFYDVSGEYADSDPLIPREGDPTIPRQSDPPFPR